MTVVAFVGVALIVCLVLFVAWPVLARGEDEVGAGSNWARDAYGEAGSAGPEKFSTMTNNFRVHDPRVTTLLPRRDIS